MIGVFLETGEGHPDLQHPFFHEVLAGIKETIGAGGYDLLLFATEQPGNGYGAHSYLKRCRHHNVDGVVLMGVDPEDEEVRRLARVRIPTVGRRRRARRAARPTYVIVRQRRGRRAWPCGTSHEHRAPPDRDDHGPARHAPGRRPPARLPRGAAGAAGSPSATSTSPTATSTSRAASRATAELLALDEPPTAIVRRLGHDGRRRDRAPPPRPGCASRRPLGHRLRRHPARRPPAARR